MVCKKKKEKLGSHYPWLSVYSLSVTEALVQSQLLRGFPLFANGSNLDSSGRLFVDQESTTTSYCSAVVIHLKRRSDDYLCTRESPYNTAAASLSIEPSWTTYLLIEAAFFVVQ